MTRAATHPRLLHIVPALLGPGGLYGGAERYALELSRMLSRRTPVRLVGFGPRPSRQRQGDLDIFVVRNWLRGRRFVGSPAGPGLLPHLHWADIIHCHQPHTMSSSLALLYARATGKPVFSTDHNGGGLALQSFLDVSGWYTAHLWVSEFSRRQAARRAADCVVYGGVDADRFAPDPGAPRSGEALFVGRLLPIKGLDDLLAAVDHATPLTLLGPEPDAPYAAHLRALAVGKPVRFLPAADDAVLIDAYRRALCLILPSIAVPGAVPELLALVVLEAMACGTPVIGTDVGGIGEMVRDGETGFLVPPHDPAALRDRWHWLRDHPDQAQAMGAAARRRVLDLFTWQAVADRCWQAYGLPPHLP